MRYKINYMDWQNKRKSFVVSVSSFEKAKKRAEESIGVDDPRERVISIVRHSSAGKEGFGNPKNYK